MARIRNPPRPEGPGWTPGRSPLHWRRRPRRRPTVLQLGGRFKRPEPERRLRHPARHPSRHPARRPRIESPGHWVKVGAGTRAQTRSQGAGSPPPSQGRLLPRCPLRPGRPGAESEFSLQGWRSLGVAAPGGYTRSPEGSRRGAGRPPSLSAPGWVGSTSRISLPGEPHTPPPLTLPSRVTQSARGRSSCLTGVWARAGGRGAAQVSGC